LVFPVQFLHAAHIKPRHACSDHERRDIANVAMMICVFGCDAIFELGWCGRGRVDRDGCLRRSRASTRPAYIDFSSEMCTS
jgi:hypothetical protein